ncbi:ABC transporter integral membrane type 1 [Penicillium angulare]|uniref:ABC transporter integral membrane type 1 n=1 Tax=Penicillium angulare TaxID=116970 RepID=UPI0025418F4B|nr:ABC transporter integral membrane type 1 [Penicillium angulare]KAJ5288093.1 ABC transporter integral membrane type 1 [Penicillium angulare]
MVTRFWISQVRKAAFSHTLKLSSDFYSQKDLPEIIRIIHTADSLSGVLDLSLLEFLPTLARLAAASFAIYVKFGAFIFCLAISGSIVYLWLDNHAFHNNLKKTEPERRCTDLELSRATNQALEKHIIVELFNTITYHIGIYEHALDAHLETESRWSQVAIYRSISLQRLQRGLFFAISMILTHRGTSAEDIIFLTLYWPTIAGHLSRLPSQYTRLHLKFTDLKCLLAHLDIKPTIKDGENACDIGPINGRITFSDVSFRYLGQKKETLKNVCISIRPRTTVALVGRSGSGKSTLLELLLRRYDVNSGSIKIDSQDIRELTLDSLRKSIAFVPSKSQIFHNWSIWQNLTYGSFDVHFEAITEVCCAVGIHDKISSSSKQYESIVGRDLNFSDGEMQLLEIARALIRKARILVLDEPTSSLDADTEAMIFEMLGKLNITIFMSANRLSSLKRVDEIIVLEQGVIKERGNHNELMETHGGVYQRLYSQWSE